MKRLLFVVLVLFANNLFAQHGFNTFHDITFDFLEINPNARIGGFGEVDVVGSSFYYDGGLYRNPALLSRHSKNFGVNFSYSPYMTKHFNNLNLLNLNGFYAFSSKNTIGINFTMYDRGEKYLSDELGQYLGNEHFFDLCLQGSYSHSFNNSISTGLSVKYVKSDSLYRYEPDKRTVNAFAIDLGFNYDNQYELNNQSLLKTSFGASISNFGPKVSYDNVEDKFLPTKLLLGLFINPDLYLSNKLRLSIELGYQAEKYLVPTPEFTLFDSVYTNPYSDITSFQALYQSFYDAPGGFSEEIDEIMHKFGSEFRLNFSNSLYFALRHGRIIENENKGNRKYQTFGVGGGYREFKVDFKMISFAEYESLNGTWIISFGYRKSLDLS